MILWFVSVLDVASLKPAADIFGSPNKETSKVFTGKSSNLFMNVASNPNQISAAASGESCHESPQIHALQSRENDLCCKIGHSNDLAATVRPNDRMLESSAANACNGNNEACGTKSTEGPKRKGDIEYELQLQMALNATAAEVHESGSGPDLKDGQSSSSSLTPPSQAGKRIRTNEPSVCAQGSSMAVWSRKLGPPLYWAEVFCSGETLTGRWVHIDAANGVIDGEEKVEAAAAACRRSLRYVVAFAGNGAKDVTRRYCTKWYTIASQRINSQWWNSVLSPLKELESRATGGVVSFETHWENSSSEVEKLKGVEVPGSLETCSNEAGGSSSGREYLPNAVRLTEGFDIEATKPQVMNIDAEYDKQISGVANRSYLEDMELETRALTEPLPTNQQAYRNHHLYAIERWLTKYQILHPKGPILGYCSGHPVYPRTCVHTLQTKQRWLRDGLQIKENESPAKVVKRSQKFNKVQTSEPNVCDVDDAEDTISLYGKWQMEPLCLPHAVNGMVPKNERGQVDVWSEKCLPPGTTHLRLPRMVPVVKRLEIDFAPAMVGFEFRNGRSVPVFEGIVVCTEFKDAIMEAYAEEEERREAEEKKRDKAQAIARWYQLLSNMVTRQRLKSSYEVGSSSQKDEPANRSGDPCGTQVEDNVRLSQSHHGRFKDAHSYYQSVESTGDHEHVFPVESQSFDEESSVRTKRCPCGFSIEVEEM
eukprot:TRINITY_DN4533_c0_g1_i2.p1 TRINITY_DN4533_c0_g1~~TRINITY_DN4533_c0_g1_i2.p1  ORF type:complete len:708 (-),score=186.07 TRINITY_DN4533_c0_g1_i2:263-2386(-)